MKTGIALFVYNRPEHTRKVLDGLKENDISHLYIFADGPKKEEHFAAVKEVRNLVHTIDWCQTEIIMSDKNKGLANSIVSGVNYVLERDERVIVLEDDCVPAVDFVKFMNKCFDEYEYQEKVMNITGYSLPVYLPSNYNYDIYFSYRSCSWGWGTWKRAWKLFNRDLRVLDDKLNSPLLTGHINNVGRDLIPTLKKSFAGQLDIWAAFWAVNIIINQGICVNPVNSFIKNIGFDGTGVHCTNIKKFDVNLIETTAMHLKFPPKIEIDDEINNRIRDFFVEEIVIGLEFKKYIKEQKKEKVMIFGTGKAGNIALELLQNSEADIIGFLDNNPDKWGICYLNKKIFQPNLKVLNEADRIIIASSWKNEIMTQLIDMGIKRQKLILMI